MPYGNKKLESGHAASHPPQEPRVVYLSPATGTEKNVISDPTKPEACWKLDDGRFDFDSCFVKPQAKAELAELAALRAAHPGCPMSLFGHADPTGDENYNKSISGRRAEAIYAILIRDAARWATFYTAAPAGKQWGLRETQVMLTAIGFDTGGTSGSATAASTAAIKKFQKSKGLTEDGDPGPNTRNALIPDYMAFLWPTACAKTDFLGKGADPGGRGDIQGCSEFNLVMIFSASENATFQQPANHTQRNAENSVNRRVLIYLFPKTFTLPADWPCPRIAEGVAGCKKRFFSDSTVRLSNQAARREYPTTKDTFACRFYDRFSNDSPCEAPGAPTPEIKHKVTGKLFWNRTWDYNDETKPIPAIKEYLPGARVELFVKPIGGALAAHAETFLDDDGAFSFTDVPKSDGAELKISLEYKDGKIVVLKGKSNHKSEPKFEIKTNKVIWHQMAIDAAPLTNAGDVDIDLGDIEIKTALFVDLCDTYKSIWFGHKRIVELASDDLPLCETFFPETGISHVSGITMHLLVGDLKDRDVILHEYGHFITGVKLSGLDHPGYGYNDDAAGQHGPATKEHYEAAWIEGHATFLSCAMTDDPHYHDGYDTTFDMHLDKDNTQIGPHNEASIQEALWDIHKVQGIDFKTGFWKALTDFSKRKPNTVFDFFDNWKDHGCPDIDKVIASFKKFNIEFGYRYKAGADRFTNVAPPKTIDVPKQEFQTVVELHGQFGTVGAGTQAAYNEEFYNRNKHFNAGQLAAGSTIADPKVAAGKKYIVPERFQVKK
jgi:hypothetical protein